MFAHAFIGPTGEIVGVLGETDVKAYPKMSITFQVKDIIMTIKQKRRIIFGWSEDLEHLIRDLSNITLLFLNSNAKGMYITQWIEMYDPRTKNPTVVFIS